MGSPEVHDNAKHIARTGDRSKADSGSEATSDATMLEQSSQTEQAARVDKPHVSLQSQETVSADLDDTRIHPGKVDPRTTGSNPQADQTIAEMQVAVNRADGAGDPTIMDEPSSIPAGAQVNAEKTPADSATTVRKGNLDTIAGQASANASDATLDGQIQATLDGSSQVNMDGPVGVTAGDGTLETLAPDQGITVKPGATVKSGSNLAPESIQTMETVAPMAGQQTGFSAAEGAEVAAGGGSAEPQMIGDYEILSELGRGGMGVVYKARHRTLRRVVALKMILSRGNRSKKTIDRFLSEARAVAHLQHPGIVQIFDIGEHDGLPYFSLEFVEGSDLQQDLDGKPSGPRRAAELVESICRAMHYAHENGILHRDLKPANILLGNDGVAKITDFGLAKEVDAEGSGETTMGTVMGSPSYMPPEQARGDVDAVSPKSDQYSMGAVLYQMLTARPPFLSDRPFDTVMQVINNEAVTPRELQGSVPGDLETICMKALQKDQDARYEDCGEMADDLRRYLNGEPILAKPVSRAIRVLRWCRRNPKIALPTAVATVFVGLTAIIASWAWMVTAAQAEQIAQEKDNVVEEKEEADRQRAIAVAQKDQAEQNEALAKRQANLALQNIQYVITDVDQRLKTQPGMSDLRIAMLEGASKKWNELDVEMTGGVRGEAIPTLMALRQLIAVAFTELDKLEDADQEFEKLFKLGQERVDLKGNDAARTNQAKIAMAWAPVKRRVDSSPAEAMELLNGAIALVEDTLNNPKPEEGSPSENDIRELLAVIQQNLGVEYLEQGQLAETAKQFEAALKNMATVLVSIRSADGYEQLDDNAKDTLTAMKQISHDKSAVGLAYILMRQGQTERSIELYKEAIAGRREIFDRRQTMLPLKVELAGYLGNYGQSLLWIDDLDGAEPLLDESLRLSNEILQADPEKAAYKRALTTAQYRMGSLRDMQGERESDAAGLFEACHILRRELNDASSDQKNQVNLMLVSARAGKLEEARKLIDQFGKSEEKDGELHLERARALTQLSRHADEADQEALLVEAVEAVQRAVAEGYGDPFRVNAEPDLRPLRDREAFQKALSELKSKQ